MTDPLPTPLVPAEVDLRDFGFMPLDVRTLLTSSFWIKAKKDPRVAHAAMSLWCESWHQVPTASLPNDDEVLAELARCDEKEWKRVKERALAHFVECSDGRLYHRHVAKKALESWASKQAQRERTRKATEARKKPLTPPDDDGTTGNREPSPRRDDDRNGERDDQRNDARDVHQGTVKGREGIEEKTTSSSAGPTEQDGEGSEKAGRTPTIPCPYEAIVAAYHRELPGLPSVRLTSGPTWVKRQKAMRSLWGWVLSSRKSDGTPRAETAEQALGWVQGYFRRAGENDFVMGRTHRSAEHANWTADFDFLLTDKGMKQVIEKTATRSAA